MALGRKLVGSAQRVERHTILQHGSILLRGDQGDVSSLQSLPIPHQRGEITIADLVDSVPPATALVAALTASFEQTFGIRFAPATLDSREKERAAAERIRFESDEWTWRR